MAKISADVAVKMADALNRQAPAQLLSEKRHRHQWAEFTVTFVNDFDLEAMTINRGAGGLWGFYIDLEVFRIRRGELIPATAEEVAHLERFMDYNADTLNGLV